MRRKSWGIFLALGTLAVLLIAGHTLQDHSRVIKSVPINQKIVALTFDDGPHPQTTRALLSVLAAKKVRATFFLLGESAARFPDLAAAIAAAGHELASHGYHHRYPNRRTRTEFLADLDQAEKSIAAAGERPVLYRPPGGGYNDALVAELARRGYTTVLWSIDPRDWDRRSTGQIVATVTRHAAPGAIILLHEGLCAVNTPPAVEQIIDRLRAEGYEFVTVGELLQRYEIRN